MKELIVPAVLFLLIGCTGQIPPLLDLGSNGPHTIKTESTPILAQVGKSPERQQYSLLVRTVKDARFEETVGQHYGGFPEKVVYSYIGDRLSHEAVTEKLRDTLSASGFQISQGWGASREPDLELQSELLKYAVYTRGGLGSQNTVANVSVKVHLRDLRSQKVIFEDIVSKSQTVTSKSPELLNTVVDQTVVAIANHPALTRGLPLPGSLPPPFPTVLVQKQPQGSTPSPSGPSTQKSKPGAGGRQQASTPEPPVKQVGKEQKWAVVVGIGKYQDPKLELGYTRNDAQEIYNYLIDPKGGGFPKDNVLLLLDEQATKVSILRALGTFLARNALKNHKVFIFYAGHGAPEADYTRKEADGFSKYLVPYDADTNDLFATAIPMADIRTIFERIESDQLIFVADACYSGASGGRTFSTVKEGKARAIRITGDFVENLSKGTGRIIIAASDVNEVSLELSELKHGIFTYYLLEGLHGLAKDGRVSVREVYDYLYEKVSQRSKQAGGNQHPIMKGEMRGEIFF